MDFVYYLIRLSSFNNTRTLNKIARIVFLKFPTIYFLFYITNISAHFCRIAKAMHLFMCAIIFHRASSISHKKANCLTIFASFSDLTWGIKPGPCPSYHFHAWLSINHTKDERRNMCSVFNVRCLFLSGNSAHFAAYFGAPKG